MRAVNLLPRDDARRSSEKTNVVVLAAVGAAVLLTALLAGLFMMANSKVAEKQRTLDGLQDELAAIPTPPPAQTQNQDALASEKGQRVSALGSALSHRVAWDRVLRELSLVLPEDVWLSSLVAKAPASASTATSAAAPSSGPSPAPTGVKVDGYTYSHDAVARLLTRLAVVPDLTNVQLDHSTLQKVAGGRSIVQFTIAADVRQPGGS